MQSAITPVQFAPFTLTIQITCKQELGTLFHRFNIHSRDVSPDYKRRHYGTNFLLETYPTIPTLKLLTPFVAMYGGIDNLATVL
jgi:hypothetical protein